MISYIRGKIIHKSPTYIILEANNIGYHIRISLNTYKQLNREDINTDKNVLILTLLHIREDAHIIYGFYDEKERYIFKQLITVNGIGYSTANVALSYMDPIELTTAIMNGRVDVIKKIKGIGEKSASRIILELKDKISKTNNKDQIDITINNNQTIDIAKNALITLGFAKNNVEKTLNKLSTKISEQTDVETLVKEALKYL